MAVPEKWTRKYGNMHHRPAKTNKKYTSSSPGISTGSQEAITQITQHYPHIQSIHLTPLKNENHQSPIKALQSLFPFVRVSNEVLWSETGMLLWDAGVCSRSCHHGNPNLPMRSVLWSLVMRWEYRPGPRSRTWAGLRGPLASAAC